MWHIWEQFLNWLTSYNLVLWIYCPDAIKPGPCGISVPKYVFSPLQYCCKQGYLCSICLTFFLRVPKLAKSLWSLKSNKWCSFYPSEAQNFVMERLCVVQTCQMTAQCSTVEASICLSGNKGFVKLCYFASHKTLAKSLNLYMFPWSLEVGENQVPSI